MRTRTCRGEYTSRTPIGVHNISEYTAAMTKSFARYIPGRTRVRSAPRPKGFMIIINTVISFRPRIIYARQGPAADGLLCGYNNTRV